MKARRLTIEDAPLWCAVVKKMIPRMEWDRGLINKADAAGILTDPHCYLIVAEDESGVVGFLSAYRFPNLVSAGYMAYLYDIMVQEQSRNQGCGRALINELLQHCKAEGVVSLWAGTETVNKSARRTFEATGASIAGDSYVEYEWRLS
jgi:ribosomal protein S18 acetylase RimI-like enzyme